jgi:hypothetical protein
MPLRGFLAINPGEQIRQGKIRLLEILGQNEDIDHRLPVDDAQ